MGLALCVGGLAHSSFAHDGDSAAYISQEAQAAPSTATNMETSNSSLSSLGTRSPATELKVALDQYFRDNPALGQGSCASYFKVLDSDRVLYSYRGNAPMVPASNLKVLTTSTALDMLGTEYQFTTELWGAPVDATGTINGNLYLRGNGDPTNTPPWHETPTALYESLAQTLVDSGVKSIQGDIVADDSPFDRQFYPEGWADHYHLDSYSAPVSGLSLNGNLIDVRIEGGNISLYPPNNYFQVQYTPEGAYDTAVERQRGSNVITVRGPLSNATRGITVDNPPLFAASTFAQILQERGIAISGQVRLIRPIGEPAAVVTQHQYASVSSPNLLEIVTEINQQSDNLLAEHVFRTIGARYAGRGSAINGEACVKHFLENHHIDTEGLHMVDGCGLSTLDRVTPNQLVDTFIAMARSANAAQFKQSLASNEHGTLRYRFPNADVCGKTGTLDHYSSLSGYVTTPTQQTVVFSMMFNEIEDISVAIDIQNKVAVLLAQWNEML